MMRERDGSKALALSPRRVEVDAVPRVRGVAAEVHHLALPGRGRLLPSFERRKQVVPNKQNLVSVPAVP